MVKDLPQGDAPTAQVSAAIELAKSLEHRARDPEAALAVVETLLSRGLPLGSRVRGEIEKRRARLGRKVERIRSRSS